VVDFVRGEDGRMHAVPSRPDPTPFVGIDFDELLREDEALELQRRRLLDVLRVAAAMPAARKFAGEAFGPAVEAAARRPRLEVVGPVEPPKPKASKPKPKPVELSPDQEQAVDHVVRLLGKTDQRVVTFAGAAGTGKTTCVREILARLGWSYVQAAPTGKAALRLRQVTGDPAVTLHRIAYRGARELDDGELDFRRRERGSVRGGDLMNFGSGDADPFELEEGEGLNSFGKRIAAALRGGGRAVIACDEASMVGRKLLEDLIGRDGVLGPRVKLLAVGDHCQLPPVKADPAFDLERADAKLERVHRQAVGPLLSLVTHLRTERVVLDRRICQRFGFEPEYLSAHELAQRAAISIDFAGDEWVGLVGTNRQRLAVNRLARKGIGFPAMAEGPQVGELVIALDNSYAVPCANGEIGTVLEVEPWRLEDDHGPITGYRVRVDFGDRAGVITVPGSAWSETDAKKSPGRAPKAVRDRIWRIAKGFGEDALEARRVAVALVGLAPAYSLTVHKSQGSEWPSGAFVLGGASWLGADAWRLGYTAATRFRDSADFVIGCAA